MEPRELHEEKVLALPDFDRTILLEKLVDSLRSDEEKGIERAWVIEAEERMRAFEAGEMGSISLSDLKKETGIE
ncbi:MAG: addiction module protein [Candidatus Hydrogenedentota bacterium]